MEEVARTVAALNPSAEEALGGGVQRGLRDAALRETAADASSAPCGFLFATVTEGSERRAGTPTQPLLPVHRGRRGAAAAAAARARLRPSAQPLTPQIADEARAGKEDGSISKQNEIGYLLKKACRDKKINMMEM